MVYYADRCLHHLVVAPSTEASVAWLRIVLYGGGSLSSPDFHPTIARWGHHYQCALRSCQDCYRNGSLSATSLCRHRVQTISSPDLGAGISWVGYCWDSLPSR